MAKTQDTSAMQDDHPAAFVIPFGAPRLSTDPGASVRGFRAEPGSGPLRLSGGAIGVEAASGVPSADDQFDALRTRVQSLSDPWSRSMHAFVDAYFAFVADEVARSREEIAARLSDFGGLYVPEDLRFAAWLPLPLAHVPTPAGHRLVPFAFWSGATLFTIDPSGGQGTDTVGDGLLPTEALGIDRQRLVSDPVEAVRACLPAAARRFWEDVEVPSGSLRTDPAMTALVP